MLNAEQQATIVAVLHDLNHACRYAEQIIVMKTGGVVAQGDPNDVITEQLVEEVYGLKCQIIDDPQTGTPLVIPRASPHVRAGLRAQAFARSATGLPLSALASCGVSTSSAYSSASGPL